MDISIVSYNIWGMPWGTKRIHEILMWLFCTSGADVICLQEVFSKYHREIIRQKAAAVHWQALFPEDPCWAGTCLNAFHSGSGLCILVHPSFSIQNQIPFVRFTHVDSYIERLVTKGFFGVTISKEDKSLSILNTHLIADMTECSPLRVAHGHARRFQEKQLMEAAKTIKEPTLIVGDLNQEEHHYLHRLYLDEDYTFPSTLEQLDHVVCLPRDERLFETKEVCFFQDILFSDHIPIRVKLQLKSKDKPD